MAAIIACHRTGRIFDYDAVPSTPFRYVPGTEYLIDSFGVNAVFPEPSPNDPFFTSKSEARAEALADAARYTAAADAARK